MLSRHLHLDCKKPIKKDIFKNNFVVQDKICSTVALTPKGNAESESNIPFVLTHAAINSSSQLMLYKPITLHSYPYSMLQVTFRVSMNNLIYSFPTPGC